MTDTLHFSRSDQAALKDAALHLTGSEGFAHDAEALGAYDGDRLLAVMVIQNKTTTGAHVHFGGSDGWPRPDIVKTFCLWLFKMRRLPHVTFPINASNVPAQIAALKIGAMFNGIVGAGVFNQNAVVLMTMTPDMCRFFSPSPDDKKT